MANQPAASKTLVAFRLPNEVMAAIEACAAADAVNRTDVAIAALRKYLAQRGYLIRKDRIVIQVGDIVERIDEPGIGRGEVVHLWDDNETVDVEWATIRDEAPMAEPVKILKVVGAVSLD